MAKHSIFGLSKNEARNQPNDYIFFNTINKRIYTVDFMESYKLTPEVQKILCDCIADSMSIAGACRIAQIDKGTFYGWKKKAENEKLPEFVALFKKIFLAHGEAERKLVKSIRDAGETDWKASHAILKRRHEEDWGEKQVVEIKTTIKEELKLDSNLDVQLLNDDEALMFFEILEKIKSKEIEAS